MGMPVAGQQVPGDMHSACVQAAAGACRLGREMLRRAAGAGAPVYQCRKALRRNMAVNCCDTRWNISWMAVELPTNVAAILRPLGAMSQMDDLTLLGIHSTKYDEFLFCTFSICSSTCAGRHAGRSAAALLCCDAQRVEF